MEDLKKQRQPSEGADHAGLGALARIGWMVVGTVLILSLGMAIASQPAWSFGARDVFYWGAVLGTGFLRFVDVTKLNGQTTKGDRATLADLHRYLVVLAAFSSLLWVGAQSVHL
jgi:hypothetical protein